MNQDIADSFENGFAELLAISREGGPFTLESQAQPKVIALLSLVEANPHLRDYFIERFKEIILSLKDQPSILEFDSRLFVLRFCMDRLQWKEIENALKTEFPSIPDPSYRLQVELLIKYVYDYHWDGGDFDWNDIIGPRELDFDSNSTAPSGDPK